MSELKELYNDVILFHQAKPRNFRKLENANRTAEGVNPLCGDQLTIYLYMEDGAIKDIGFEGKGCAISVASASMMTHMIKGKSVQEAEVLFNEFHKLLLGEQDEAETSSGLGHLKEVFSGVHKFPMRVKCATLSWHTLRAALAGEEATSTEHLGPDIDAAQMSG